MHKSQTNFDKSIVKALGSYDTKTSESLLRHTIFRVSDTPFSYRQINYLDKDNLLPEKTGRQSGTWREFNVLDMVYLFVVEELRNYGFSNNKIHKFKKSFFEEIKRPKGMGIVRGELYILAALHNMKPLIIIFTNGNVILHNQDKFNNEKIDLTLPASFISVDLTVFTRIVINMINSKLVVSSIQLTLIN